MLAVDLHAHTRFFHARPGRPTWYDALGLDLLTAAAEWRELDAVAVTNHDYAYSADRSFPTVPGVEISTTLGHLVVVGPDPPSRTTPGELEPEAAVELAHERGCAAILAHPYRNGTLLESDAPFDAIELNGKNPEHVVQTRELADRLELPLVGGSDAHFPFEVGRAYTRVDADAPTPEAVADAIREGDVEAVVKLGRAHELLDKVYNEVHRRKATMRRR
ncbi:PHP-associated domain-containing protein [Halopelagius fulvigenes]|uniref:PHP-associated domain-containing protein n=1 Tax=Halopelagius fulvigenes TaxID=1198324 RepID=A0ABD5TV56_9EURY